MISELASKLQVRLGAAPDLGGIHTWLDALAGHSWRGVDLLQAIRGEGRLLLVAVECSGQEGPSENNLLSDKLKPSTKDHCDDKQAVRGLILAQRILDETTLLYMAVDPASRGRGIAKLLLRQLQAGVSAVDGARIVLEVRESNDAARGLYLSCGFEQVGERRNYYPALHDQQCRENAMVLAWQKPV